MGGCGMRESGTASMSDHAASAFINAGHALAVEGHFPLATAAFRCAIEHAPTNALAHTDLGYMLLLRGQWTEGWREHRWRWRLDQRQYRQYQLWPWTQMYEWDGSSLHGKSILLCNEQGNGDLFQFIRFAKLLGGQGAHVVVGCPSEMAKVIATAPGVQRVMTWYWPWNKCDWKASVMDLPYFLKVSRQSIETGPYLSVPAGAEWPLKNQGTGKLKIGLCWAGSPTYGNDRWRSAPLNAFASLFTVPHVAWYSLQHGERSNDLQTCGLTDAVEDIGGQVKNWSETAAAVEQMDLIISVDTAVAHLAGAVGKPVWLLLGQQPCWRWGVEQDRTVWYPSMRLFRQAGAEGWAGLIERVQGHLLSVL
jgi:hypothetical protein